jgi:antitoxin VapB
MRTVSIFMNSRNQAIRIPRDMEYQGVSELEIIRDGETLILRPVRPPGHRCATWRPQILTF